MNFIIDTNKLSDFFMGDETVRQQITMADIIYVPTIVIGEFKNGAYRGSKTKHNLAILNQFLGRPSCTVLNVDQDTAEHYAQTKTYLQEKGTPIPINDVWIAALCVQYNLPLLTRDSDFSRLPQVQMLDM